MDAASKISSIWLSNIDELKRLAEFLEMSSNMPGRIGVLYSFPIWKDPSEMWRWKMYVYTLVDQRPRRLRKYAN